VFPRLVDRTTLFIKIGDFGVSKRISNDGSTVATKTGSQDYMAPEIDGMERYTTSVDLWSLGCVLFRMISGDRPFTPGEMGRYVYGQGEFPRSKLEEVHLSETGIIFIESLLKPSPTERPTADFALQSGWITAEPFGFQVTEGLAQILQVLPRKSKYPET
jgi:serine/threonine protein kinase